MDPVTNTQKKFMAEAISLARQNLKDSHGGPFGAVIVKDGEIIARGSNHVTTLNDPTAHAEIMAIREACGKLNSFQLDDCELYTSCEPCPMCLGAIYWARPGKIFYAATRADAANAGFDDDFIYREIGQDPQKRSIIANQFMRDEAVQVFREWIDSDKKIPY